MECHGSEIKRSGCAPLSRGTCNVCTRAGTARNRAQHAARAKRANASSIACLLLEINGQFMEIARMYGNWLATSSRYVEDHPQVLEWLLAVLESSVHAYLGACSYLEETWPINEHNEANTRRVSRELTMRILWFLEQLRTDGIFFRPKGASANLRDALWLERSLKLNYAYK